MPFLQGGPPPHRPGWAPWPGGGCFGETGAHTGWARGLGPLRGTTVVQKEGQITLGLCVWAGHGGFSKKKTKHKQTEEKTPVSGSRMFSRLDSNVPVW